MSSVDDVWWVNDMDEWITCDHWTSEWMWWFIGMRSVDGVWSLDEWMTWDRLMTCDEWMNDMWSPTHITEKTAKPQGHAFIPSSAIIHSPITGHPLISCHSLIQWSHRAISATVGLSSQPDACLADGESFKTNDPWWLVHLLGSLSSKSRILVFLQG